ncbi:MAG: cytochrome-c peroxidase, partial [Bacteroidota bacterium]
MKINFKYIGLGSCLLLMLAISMLPGCGPDDPLLTPSRQVIELEVPDHFPKPEIPADNPLTQAKIDLGKKLFFDPILSSDGTISCSSCHDPALAFSDPRTVSLGVNDAPGERNAMALFNLVYHQSFFWDGSNPMLETQALFPIEAEFEMNTPIDTAVARLRAKEEYQRLFQIAFEDSISPKTLTYALSAYERSLISAGSKYDKFVEAGFDSTMLSESEWRGYKLYFSEVPGVGHPECFHCHGGFNF